MYLPDYTIGPEATCFFITLTQYYLLVNGFAPFSFACIHDVLPVTLTLQPVRDTVMLQVRDSNSLLRVMAHDRFELSPLVLQTKALPLR